MLNGLKEIAAADVGNCRFSVPLAELNSWRIGGPADLLVEPASVEQVSTLVRAVRQQQLPLVVIGQGTNLLFDDAGVRGVVMRIGAAMSRIDITGQRIVVGGGAWVPHLARTAMRAGLSGLEHCIGIPGTVGGLVMMNGGSQRRSIGENIERVTIVDASGEIRTLSWTDCDFSYRHSALQNTGAVVVEAELTCPKSEIRQIRHAMLADLCERRGKFPRKLPNCGSVFLSTAEMHASVGPPGKVIEETGLKGLRSGLAEVSRQHANFIVNLGGATAADVLALIRQVRQQVYDRIGFDIRCEVRYVSTDGEIIPAHLKSGPVFEY